MWRLFNSMRDMYSNVTLILTAVIVIVLTQVNPKAKPSEETAKPPGQMMVCASWAGHDDVDLWFRPATQEKATGYSNKNGTIADLLLDDLGTSNDPHIECQFAKSLPDGLWIINLHGYSIVDQTVKVHVMARMGGVTLIDTHLDLRQAQERTVAQFRLAGGQLVPDSSNSVFVPLRSAK